MGNLREVTLPNGDVIEYLVDGQGRRVGKLYNGVLERAWLWRGQLQPVAELDGAGNVVARFVYAEGVNVPELMVMTTATYRFVKDHLGSVRKVVDVATNAVVQQIDYDAWGRVLFDTNPGLQPFGFAGGLNDPDTGLVRFGDRDLDASAGRWLAADDVAMLSLETNRYAYVESDPVNSNDPTGRGNKKVCDHCHAEADIKRHKCLATCGDDEDCRGGCLAQWLRETDACNAEAFCKPEPKPIPPPKTACTGLPL